MLSEKPTQSASLEFKMVMSERPRLNQTPLRISNASITKPPTKKACDCDKVPYQGGETLRNPGWSTQTDGSWTPKHCFILRGCHWQTAPWRTCLIQTMMDETTCSCSCEWKWQFRWHLNACQKEKSNECDKNMDPWRRRKRVSCANLPLHPNVYTYT